MRGNTHTTVNKIVYCNINKSKNMTLSRLITAPAEIKLKSCPFEGSLLINIIYMLSEEVIKIYLWYPPNF